MCLCRFYFPLALGLANDVELNPVGQRSGPRPLSVFTVGSRTYKIVQLTDKITFLDRLQRKVPK